MRDSCLPEANPSPSRSITTQYIFVGGLTVPELVLALYEFALVTLAALIVSKFWSEKLNKIVNLTIAPILIIVGIRFLFS